MDAERTFDNIQHSFITKRHRRLGEGNFFIMAKGIYEKSPTNIILSGERLKAFSLRSGTGQG